MKIQCSCGAKHVIEVTPDMAGCRLQFVCPVCGLDSSEFVTSLVQQELGQAAPPPAPAVPMGMPVEAGAAPPVPAAPRAPRAAPAVRLHVPAPAAAAPASVAAAAVVQGTPCLKHPGQVAVEKCFICSKPICPKCMELFGYVCSPLCKAKADSHGIAVPVYALQRDVVEARLWRKVVLVGGVAGGILAAVLGVWFWYAWFGCVPKPVFSVRFQDKSYSGQSEICGKDKDQIVFLHGDTLARWDMKAKKQVWSHQLLDRAKIAAAVDKEIKDFQARQFKLADEGIVTHARLPPRERMIAQMERAEAAGLNLHVKGQNIWVGEGDKLRLYDWDTGVTNKELTINSRFGNLITRGDELVMLDVSTRKPIVTHIDLARCETRVEELGGDTNLLAAAASAGAGSRPRGAGGAELAGLPLGTPGKDMDKPMDPEKVADQVQHLPYPAKIALPAMIAGNMSQERTLRELDDGKRAQASAMNDPEAYLSLIPTADGFIQFSVKVLEARMVERSAMKAAPAKSVLDGNVSAGNSLAAAGELLNEMQRARGGDKVVDDLSRYQVKLSNPGTTETWVGEVIGRPGLFPLKTVNVVTGNKSLMVFNKANQRLWQAPLSFDVTGGTSALEPGASPYGQAPCMEHKGVLYVADQGMLSAFDIKTGKSLWRLPSVGVAGMFFDDKDMLYLNTTTAGPDKIKYSRQIDITDKDNPVIQKLDPADGRIIWSVQNGSLINQVTGKFILTVQYYMASDPDEEDGGFSLPTTGFEPNSYLRIRRLNPKSGRTAWEHFQERAPLDVQIDQNVIRLVFKKEVQVLKFTSF